MQARWGVNTGRICSQRVPAYQLHKPLSCRARDSRPQASKQPSSTADMARLFDQHKLLMSAGFSYDQACMILQICQRRRSATELLPSSSSSASPASTGYDVCKSSAEAPETAISPADVSITDVPALRTLEERVAFLELELLKQSLATPPPAGPRITGTDSGSSNSNDGFSNKVTGDLQSTAAYLNPAAAGASSLSAAAAASRRSADAYLYRQRAPWGSGSDLQGTAPTGFTGTAQLAAAAEAGRLDPDVYVIADALAVRQGMATTPAEPHQLSPLNPLSPQQQRQPSSIWGRSRAHYQQSRPLSAHAWGEPSYDSLGEPLLTQQDLQDDVPYQPTGWGVVGTVVVMYLGVIVTFLAMCVADVGITDVPL